jgi:hypothetical protein
MLSVQLHTEKCYGLMFCSLCSELQACVGYLRLGLRFCWGDIELGSVGLGQGPVEQRAVVSVVMDLPKKYLNLIG